MGGQPGRQDERGNAEWEVFQKCSSVRSPLWKVGNINAKLKYEQWVPPSYRKVDSSTPQVIIQLLYFHLTMIHNLFQTLVEQWIFAKYGREEFIHPERQSYTSGFMEVFL